jgi:hypothetical protein
VLASLLSGDFITGKRSISKLLCMYAAFFGQDCTRPVDFGRADGSHGFLKLLEVLLLIRELLLKLQELLLLALLNGIVFVGFLALLEGISAWQLSVSKQFNPKWIVTEDSRVKERTVGRGL